MTQKTFSAYDLLLGAFAPQPEDAAYLLQLQWEKLVAFLEFKGAGIVEGEQLADKVMDIATRRLQEGESIANIRAFLYETARYVWLNHYRKTKRTQRWFDQYEYWSKLKVLGAQNEELEPVQVKCYQQCLHGLDTADHDLLAEYTSGNTQTRLALAERKHMTRNSLTVRINRMRSALRKCYAECLKKEGCIKNLV